MSKICRMCGGTFSPMGRWDDPNVCRSCLTERFCRGPATAGYEPAPARAHTLRGTARGADLAHNQEQVGATPTPATNPPPAQPRETTAKPHNGPPAVFAGPASLFALPESESAMREWWELLSSLSHVRQAEILSHPAGEAARRLAAWAVAIVEVA